MELSGSLRSDPRPVSAGPVGLAVRGATILWLETPSGLQSVIFSGTSCCGRLEQNVTAIYDLMLQLACPPSRAGCTAKGVAVSRQSRPSMECAIAQAL
jgi:hypothetical protein